MNIKQTALVFFALLCSATAFADDGGTFGIQVRGIDPENKATGIIATAGSTVSVTGSDAAYLAARLPNTISVSPADELSNRSLELYSRAYSVSFRCHVADPQPHADEELAGPVTFLNAPTCTIGFDGAPTGDDNITEYKGTLASFSLKNAKRDYNFQTINLIREIEGLQPIKTERGTRIAIYGNNIDVFKGLLPELDVKPSEITLKGDNASVAVGCLKDKVTRKPAVGAETECYVEVK